MSTIKTINVIHPSGSTNNIVNDASGNITVGNNATVTGGLTITGTLTGSTGVMNIGSGQLYKDASGNVGIGNTSANVNDQVGGIRPLLVSGSDSATTISGSLAALIIGNANTTTSNTSQLGFAALTGVNSTYFTSAAINCVFGARTNGQYPTGQLVFSTSTSLNSAPTEKMRLDNNGNLLVGTTSQLASSKVSVSSGTANATTYNTAATQGGSTLTVQQQSTTSVSTSATTLLTPGQFGSFCLVFGSDGTNRFMDVVLFSIGTGTLNVISSLNASGSPGARTYTQSSSTLRLAMASGTYTVQVSALSMSG